jgi:ABC-2 type transport system ATP-binding protein
MAYKNYDSRVLVVCSAKELLGNEEEIVRRIRDTPNGGQLLLLDPQRLLRDLGVEMTAEAVSEAMADYPDLAIRKDAEIILKSTGDAFAEAFLARYGGRIRKFVVEEPSLESVFLSLTGRDLRDQAAGARELTYAFGKRGGEHTK